MSVWGRGQKFPISHLSERLSKEEAQIIMVITFWEYANNY